MKKSYLEITIRVSAENLAKAGAVYAQYRKPFLDTIAGAESKDLLVREDDVQVLHGFDSVTAAEGYLRSDLFQNDVVRALKPYLLGDPEIRIHERQ